VSAYTLIGISLLIGTPFFISSAGSPTGSAAEDHPGGVPDRRGHLFPAVPGASRITSIRARGILGEDADQRLRRPTASSTSLWDPGASSRLRPGEGLPDQAGSVVQVGARGARQAGGHHDRPARIEGWDQKKIEATLKEAGYKSGADKSQVNWVMAEVILVIMVLYVTMVYGPIAAFLVELFPTQNPLYLDVAAVSHRQWLVRRDAAADRDGDVAATGDIYFGLWYPIVVGDHDGGHRLHLPHRDQDPGHSHVRAHRDQLSPIAARSPRASATSGRLLCGLFFA